MNVIAALFAKRPVAAKPEPADRAPPEAVAIPNPGQTIPHYPDAGLAVPAIPPRDLLAAQSTLVKQLVQTLGLNREERARWLDPVLERYAAYVHLLPASETHHHCGIGGMLRHSLEVAFYAARFTEGAVFGMNLVPARRQPYALRARLATAYAGLLHDAGKPLVDIGAMDPATGTLWNPHVLPLAEWLEQQGVACYTLFWHPGARHRRHEAFSPALVHQILGRDVMAYLCEGDGRELIDTLFMAIGNAPDLRHPMAEAVKRADAASVEFDLEHQNTRAIQAAGGSVRSLAVRVIHTMQVAVRDGHWMPNQPGQPVWVTSQGVFLGYPDSMMGVIERNRSEAGQAPLPAHPEVLLAALRESHYILPYSPSDDSQEGDTWPITILHGKDKNARAISMRALRLDRPELVFGSEPLPAPLPVTIGDEVHATDNQTAPAAVDAPGTAEPDAPTPAPAGDTGTAEAAEEPTPAVRNRRNEKDLAERRYAERSAVASGPTDTQDACAWLDKHPPLGEFVKDAALRAAGTDLMETGAQGVVAAFPSAFAGLGLAVSRIAELLLKERWIIPDPATGDRATVLASVAGKQQVAVRFTPELSRIVGLLLGASTGSGTKASPAPPAEGGSEPQSPAIRAAGRKVAFYRFLRERCAERTPVELEEGQVDGLLAEFAAANQYDLADLQASLREPPNPMMPPEGTRITTSFRYDKARAQADTRRNPGAGA